MKPSRRFATNPAVALICLLAGLSVDLVAHAHGDEPHGAPARSSTATADPDAARMPIETQFLLGLRTQRVTLGAMASSLGQIGTVIARPTGELAVVTPFSGRAFPPEGGFVRLGESVKKGQLLGTLQPTLRGAESAQLNLARSDAASRITAADARLLFAERELARRRGLRGVVSEREIQAAEAEVEIATADRARARADVGSLSGGLGIQRLTSTLDGTVVLSHASPGAQVAEGTELFRIVDLDTLWVNARLPEGDAARGVADEAVIVLVADPAVRIPGKRVALGSLVDPSTRTVQALFEIDNRERRVRVGALVDVVTTRTAAAHGVILPASALLDRNGRPTVIVKTGPEAFEVRAVGVGPRSAGSVGITAGLKPGERVVVDGAMAVLLAAGG